MEKRDLRIVWSGIVGAGQYNLYLIIEFSEDEYNEFVELKSSAEKNKFLADRLENKKIEIDGQEITFPPYYNDQQRRPYYFWFNNIYETYQEAFERLMEEKKKYLLREYRFESEEEAEVLALEYAREILNSLPVIKV